MREYFDNQLQNLQKDIIVMGTLCEEIILISLKGLDNPNKMKADLVWKSYQKIEELEHDIESRCIKLILRQQPVAKDLRVVSSVLKMVYDIKRIGVQASEVAELISNESIKLIEDISQIKEMAEYVIEMVSKGLDAFVTEDIDLANLVIEKDDIVDDYFKIIKEKLGHYFVKDKNMADQVIDLLMIAKYLEKIGDHTVNVAKWVIYSIRGE